MRKTRSIVDRKPSVPAISAAGKQFDRIIARLTSVDGDRRQKAVTRVLAETKPQVRERIIDHIITLLKSQDEPTCRRAAASLVEMGDVCVPALRDSLPDKRTRLANIEWAGDSKNRTKIAALLDIIRWDADLDIVYQAIVALGKIGDPMAVPDLIDKFQSLDSSIRLAVAWALGEIGDARAIPTVRELITDRTIPARLGANGAASSETNAVISEEARRALAKITGS